MTLMLFPLLYQFLYLQVVSAFVPCLILFVAATDYLGLRLGALLWIALTLFWTVVLLCALSLARRFLARRRKATGSEA